jgi:hypothetical protein
MGVRPKRMDTSLIRCGFTGFGLLNRPARPYSPSESNKSRRWPNVQSLAAIPRWPASSGLPILHRSRLFYATPVTGSLAFCFSGVAVARMRRGYSAFDHGRRTFDEARTSAQVGELIQELACADGELGRSAGGTSGPRAPGGDRAQLRKEETALRRNAGGASGSSRVARRNPWSGELASSRLQPRWRSVASRGLGH